MPPSMAAHAVLCAAAACLLLASNAAAAAGGSPPAVPGTSLNVSQAGASCTRLPRGQLLEAFTKGRWSELTQRSCDASNPRIASCVAPLGYQWVVDAPVCGTRQLGGVDMLEILHNKTIVFIGDSHTRNFYSRLRFKLTGSFDNLVDRLIFFQKDAHAFFNTTAKRPVASSAASQADMRMSFYWTPTLIGVGKILNRLRDNGIVPDIVVTSSGSWYNSKQLTLADFAQHLINLQQQLQTIKTTKANMVAFHLTVPTRVRGRVSSSTWDPTVQLVPQYNNLVRQSALVAPGGPAFLIDIDKIHKACLGWCVTNDGIHSNAAVYAVLIQMLMNALQPR